MTEESHAKVPIRRSSLRVVLHIWAGLCLKAAADVSGILAVRVGRDVESANTAASGTALATTLLIVAGYYLSYQLVSALDRTSLTPRSRKAVLIALPFAYFISAIVLGGTVGLIAGTGR